MALNNRIRKACYFIKTFLRLGSRPNRQRAMQEVSISILLEEVLEELSENYPVYERIDLEIPHRVCVSADRELAKTVLTNLVQNALQHFNANIIIRLTDDELEILDGLPENNEDPVRTDTNEIELSRHFSGIDGCDFRTASLICMQSGWSLSVSNHPGSRKSIKLNFTVS